MQNAVEDGSRRVAFEGQETVAISDRTNREGKQVRPSVERSTQYLSGDM